MDNEILKDRFVKGHIYYVETNCGILSFGVTFPLTEARYGEPNFKKFEESIHDVAFHPSKCYIASAGADALAKVFV